MTDALETTFANVIAEDREDRKRYWRLVDPQLERLQPRQETTLEALEIAVQAAYDENRLRHANALRDLRDGLIARLSTKDAYRAEADADAVLSGLGQVMRPGPRVPLRPEIVESVIEGLRGPFRLQVIYSAPDAPPRIIEPHGLLVGARSYLIARQPSRGEELLNFRMDRIKSAQCLNESFTLKAGFSLDEHAARAFGAYQDAEQYGEIVWRFAPKAALQAAEFQFHPNQALESQLDGSLIVRFHASGWLEMAWFLYQWGDAVEVLAPQGLRDLTDGYRRSDFEALP